LEILEVKLKMFLSTALVVCESRQNLPSGSWVKKGWERLLYLLYAILCLWRQQIIQSRTLYSTISESPKIGFLSAPHQHPLDALYCQLPVNQVCSAVLFEAIATSTETLQSFYTVSQLPLWTVLSCIYVLLQLILFSKGYSTHCRI